MLWKVQIAVQLSERRRSVATEISWFYCDQGEWRLEWCFVVAAAIKTGSEPDNQDTPPSRFRLPRPLLLMQRISGHLPVYGAIFF